MTPEDLALEVEDLLARPLTLYRLARTKYANLTGIGAAKSAGRWNLPGQEAIYTSTNSSMTILERLVHTPKDVIPSDLAMMQIGLSGMWSVSRQRLTDQNTKAFIQVFPSLSQARSPLSGALPMLQRGARPLAIAVPSVIDAHWNLILFPNAKSFDLHVQVSKINSFDFDPRLFPGTL